MEIEFRPAAKRVPEPSEFRHQVLVVVPDGAVLQDIKQLERKGVSVRDKAVTVEYEYGDNDLALADYRFVDGAFYLVKKYDTNIHWPDVVKEGMTRTQSVQRGVRERPEQVTHGVPFLVKSPELIQPLEAHPAVRPLPPETPPAPPPPPESPPSPPSPPTFPERPSFETEREWELLGRYWRLVAQIEDAQLKIEQAKVTGQAQEIPIQTRRLEIGQKNLDQFLSRHPEYAGLPKPIEIPKVDLTTVEGRKKAKSLLFESNLPPVEAGKRIIALEKAEAKLELVHPHLDKAAGTSAVRPPLKTVLTDLKEAQYLVGRLNSLGLFSQLQHGERRHNNLLRLTSTRHSLEYILKRFTPPPHTDPHLSRDFLALVHGVVDAVKKVEEGTNKNFLSRWWSQNDLTEQNKKIIQGLKKLEQFTQEHREFA